MAFLPVGNLTPAPIPYTVQTSLAPIPAGGTYVPPLPLPGQNGSLGGGTVGYPL